MKLFEGIALGTPVQHRLRHNSAADRHAMPAPASNFASRTYPRASRIGIKLHLALPGHSREWPIRPCRQKHRMLVVECSSQALQQPQLRSCPVASRNSRPCPAAHNIRPPGILHFSRWNSGRSPRAQGRASRFASKQLPHHRADLSSIAGSLSLAPVVVSRLATSRSNVRTSSAVVLERVNRSDIIGSPRSSSIVGSRLHKVHTVHVPYLRTRRHAASRKGRDGRPRLADDSAAYPRSTPPDRPLP